ncbi:MAG: HYExAFE family protein [Planctomycetia bacterium]|nr:HYExAFE family protein [Planctomycetia bacterium]
MANFRNHYEAAFEAFLRHHNIPCISTREDSRSASIFSGDPSLKTLDFIISAKQNPFSLQNFPQDSEEPQNISTQTGHFKTLEHSDITKRHLSELSWLVDIKGRRFPSGKTKKRCWVNWVTEDDLISLTRWENIFGEKFFGLFVFAYLITENVSPLEQSRLFSYHKNHYAFLGVPLSTYRTLCRRCSPRWKTFTLPVKTFREQAIPLDELLTIQNL